MNDFASGKRLVFDLGMNNGDDTDYYLRKGYRVVAVEANPFLAEAARVRFAGAIADGELTIINRAICDQAGMVSFFVNRDNDHWSSLDKGWAGRADTACHEVQVEAVGLKELFVSFGIPHYLKIDVEGADGDVLEQLSKEQETPRYVSVEDCRFGFDYIETLARGGYNGFKLLDQSTVPSLVDGELGWSFAPSSSGPFGEDVPGAWRDKASMIETYSRTVRDKAGNRLAPRTQWWDIHCARL